MDDRSAQHQRNGPKCLVREAGLPLPRSGKSLRSLEDISDDQPKSRVTISLRVYREGPPCPGPGCLLHARHDYQKRWRSHRGHLPYGVEEHSKNTLSTESESGSLGGGQRSLRAPEEVTLIPTRELSLRGIPELARSVKQSRGLNLSA